MAIQSINIGNIANDGTGDDLREAFSKINNNFAELDSQLTNVTDVSGENLGGGIGVFNEVSDGTLQFKSLVAGTGVTISQSPTEITLSSTNSINQLIFVSDSGSIVVNPGSSSINLYGGTNINTRVSGTQVFFDVDPTNLVALDTAPTLGGNLNANFNSINDVTTVTADNFIGDLTGLVYGIDVRDFDAYLGGFDFGTILQTATTFAEWVTLNFDVDYGSFTSPTNIVSDLGGFI